MTALCVNLYAGPGSGKSTTAAEIFAKLKWAGINAELVTEFAKYKVWENSHAVLDDQLYLLGKQHHKQFILNNEVDVMVTDSPLLLLLEYGKDWGPSFQDFVVSVHHRFNNYDIFLRRVKDYNPKGRLQTEEKAKEIDRRIEHILHDRKIKFESYPATPESVTLITNKILERL